MLNALTVDLEDWYHICGTAENSIPSKWIEYENRVISNTEKVLGYRAPEWSIRNNTLWALGVLKKLGIKYDSSMVPLTRMGERNFGRFPYTIKTEYGDIMEFPLTTMRCLWENLPFTGGLPLRVAPYW